MLTTRVQELPNDFDMDAARPHTYAGTAAQSEGSWVSQDVHQRYTEETLVQHRQQGWEDGVYDEGQRVAAKEAGLLKLSVLYRPGGPGSLSV